MHQSRTPFLALALAVTVAAVPAQPASPARSVEPRKDIIETAVDAGSFQTLVKAVETAGLVEALKGKGPFTVFAPSDAAFAKLPDGTVSGLLEPAMRDRLQAILTWHVVPGRVPAASLPDSGHLKTLNGQRLPVSTSDEAVQVGGARVVKADLKCSNGLIHVIDGVMLPAERNLVATARNAGRFETLLTAARRAGLVPVLEGEGPFTVFAPTDDAFARLPEGTVESLLKPENRARLAAILKHHVASGRIYSEQVVRKGRVTPLAGGEIRVRVDGSKAFAGDARIVETDIDASNGVIHVIDAVIIPE